MVNAFWLILVLSTRMPSTPATTTTSTSATNGARGTDTGAGGATVRCGSVRAGRRRVTGSGASAVLPRVRSSCSSCAASRRPALRSVVRSAAGTRPAAVTGWRRAVVAVDVVMASPSAF